MTASGPTVSFTQMKDGTREDYELLEELEKPFLAGTADRLLRELAAQAEETLSGYQITRLDHGLQAATRARRDGADLDWVVAALLHDIGDRLAPLVIFGGILLWIEALRRQASETEGSRAAVHYRSIQGFLTVMLALAVPVFLRISADDEAWIASIEVAIGLIVGIYLVLASFCWFAELKPGAVLADDSSDQLSL